MDEIRAFVGHSFTDDDSVVVGKFLNYFDQIARLDPNFTWVHAEPAEPKLLADKVLSLLSDRNAFIAICTKKERVIAPDSLKKLVFSSRFAKVLEDKIEWKTSDWIIQEIGLATGRDLSIILLLERGVREPGGLQSDIEHIIFDREFPERSFGKIVEMITALSPKTVVASAMAPDARPTRAAAIREPEPPPDDGWETPKPEWRRRDYRMAPPGLSARIHAHGDDRR